MTFTKLYRLGGVSSLQIEVVPVEQSTVAPTPLTAHSNLEADTAMAPPLVTPVENLDHSVIAHEIASMYDAGDLEAHGIENAVQDANAVLAQDFHGEIQVQNVTIQERELSSDAPVPSQVLPSEEAVQIQSEHAN